jgi:hypothetical protein
MCSFLRGIHLDDAKFKNHNLSTNEMDVSYNVKLSLKELEERLKNAQTISFHESIKESLEGNNNLPEILPKVLFSTNRQQCQALMVYEPPNLLRNLISTESKSTKFKNEEEEENCEKMLIE